MGRTRSSRARLTGTIAATAAAGLVAGLATVSDAGASPASAKLAPGIATSKLKTGAAAGQVAGKRPGGLPAGVPRTGRYAFLLRLDTAGTSTVFSRTRAAKGTASARAAARSHLAAVTQAQNAVIAHLPAKSSVLYRTHAVLAGVAVVTDVRNFDKLQAIGNVSAVYPIAPKTASNSYAVPLQGAPQAWTAYGDLGQHSTVAIIDTGVDYTHANFGGPGTVAAYKAALANDTAPVDPDLYDHSKFSGAVTSTGVPIGLYDFAGDDYNADPSSEAYQPVPKPDPNPLDCNSHGSHVAGTVAGFGENPDGTTYTGVYDESTTPFSIMRIGPGMAPRARLYAYKVFGCEGSTNVTSEAIDKAMDPNGDGDTSDHVDVVNMSLGSDYGSPNDGDSVMTNLAAQAGVTMVVASGNGGDLYDVGGSPGDAVRSIAVANSVDASSVVDSLNVTDPAAASYPAERSIAYDWATKPDLHGAVGQLTQPGNLDGCDPIDEAHKADVDGKIAFVEWTDVDADRRCGSVKRSGNLKAAGAIGFIFADDEENFGAGITGDADIPGVLVAKSGGDAIRGQLAAGTPVLIGSTTKNGSTQLDESLNDEVNSSSSRGIRDAGNVKPDVTAVGTSVFSTGMGTGNDGLNDTGTSMATPMVAGTAALVRSQHPDWTVEQVKADIMNTADADLYTGPNHTGTKYAPNRVGAGRIDVKAALDNATLAYVKDDPGAVSASFGPMAITGSSVVTATKTITVENTGNDTVTYDAAYVARTSIPGVTYSLSAGSVTVDPRSKGSIQVTITVDPTRLTKTIDPTVARVQGGVSRQYVADASGLVQFTSADHPQLRVPVYAAPRPASAMTQPSSLTMPAGAVQQAFLPLSGRRVNQGTGATAVQSTVAGFELAATSGKAPQCSATVTSGCVNFEDERSADLKNVGVTSDAPQLDSIGENPLTSANGLAFFAINTQGAWRTVSGVQQFVVWIDGNGDGVADAYLFNTRLTGSDVLVSELVDLASGDVLDIEGLNDSLGNTDTAMFDSDSIVLPVAIGAIPGVTAAKSRIRYVVEAYSGYQSDPVDTVGTVDYGTGKLSGALSFDVLKPGVAVYGSYNGNSSALLYADSPGSVLAIRRDVPAYAADKGKGALIVHFHNTVGTKAQVVSFAKQRTSTRVTLSPNPVQAGRTVTGTVTVTGTGGTPSGKVTVKHGSTTIATPTLSGGRASFTYRPTTAGTTSFTATYGGDVYFAGSGSAAASLTVSKAAAFVSVKFSATRVAVGRTVTVAVALRTVNGLVPTGTVSLVRTSGANAPSSVSAKAVSGGRATLSYAARSAGSFTFRVHYAGSGAFAAGDSGTVTLTFTR